MESGKIVMDIKEFDISKTIIEVKKSFKMQLEEKKVGLNIDINRVKRNVKADESKVSWVLANLLGNALRYVDSNGEGLIEISVKEVNNTMLVSVKDNGEGIEECDQKKIFDKFVQIKSNNKNNSGSSGLGLAICKEIIKANSGDIWVDSTIGVGSTFYFTLKLGGVIYEKDINS